MQKKFTYKTPAYCRVMLVKEEMPLELPIASNAAHLAELVRKHSEGLPSEACYSIVLDAKRRVIAVVQVSIGTLTQAMVHPREVFRPAMLANGAAIVLAHTHPSGDTNPSPEDHAVTKRIKEAADFLAIPVLDHIIVGAQRYFSYSENGWCR